MEDTDLPEVRPGDLISAVVWNQMVHLLRDYNARLKKLEAGSITGRVKIDRLVFTPPLRLGQILEIQGQNFGTSQGAQQVQFDSRLVFKYENGSNDTHLFVVVPTDLPDVKEEGKDVVVRVSNGASADQTMVKIFPMESTTPGNIVDLTWLNVVPNPIKTKTPTTLNFVARSRAGQQATFGVTITISDPTLNAGAKLFRGSTEITDLRLPLPSLTNVPFSISLPEVPEALANKTFKLFLLFRSGAMVGSLDREFPVEQTIQIPDNIGVHPTRFEVLDSNGFPDESLGKYLAATNTIQLKASQTGTMFVATTFPEVGIYEYFIKVLSGAGWSANIGGSDHGSITLDAGDFAGVDTVTKDLAFELSATSVANPSGEVEFTVRRQNHNPVFSRMLLAKI